MTITNVISPEQAKAEANAAAIKADALALERAERAIAAQVQAQDSNWRPAHKHFVQQRANVLHERWLSNIRRQFEEQADREHREALAPPTFERFADEYAKASYPPEPDSSPERRDALDALRAQYVARLIELHDTRPPLEELPASLDENSRIGQLMQTDFYKGLLYK